MISTICRAHVENLIFKKYILLRIVEGERENKKKKKKKKWRKRQKQNRFRRFRSPGLQRVIFRCQRKPIGPRPKTANRQHAQSQKRRKGEIRW